MPVIYCPYRRIHHTDYYICEACNLKERKIAMQSGNPNQPQKNKKTINKESAKDIIEFLKNRYGQTTQK